MASIPLNNSVSQTDFLKSIKDELFLLYQDAFLIDLFKYKVTNDSSCKSAPITIRSNKAIILNCDPASPNQIAFQLSHELCHATIPLDVNNNLRWFEEVLAISASYVFPAQLSCIDQENYYRYFDLVFRGIPPLFKTPLFVLNDETLSFLQSGSETPNYNDYGSYLKVAQMILPQIKKLPDIWKCVPYICHVPSGLSFFDSLEKWKLFVPSNISDSISVIISALLLR